MLMMTMMMMMMMRRRRWRRTELTCLCFSAVVAISQLGTFFASSSSLSATKLGIVTIRTIVGLLQDFRHFDGEVFLIGVTINYEDQNYLYWDGKTGVGWIVKMMISGVKNLTRLMGLKGRHYVLLAL